MTEMDDGESIGTISQIYGINATDTYMRKC